MKTQVYVVCDGDWDKPEIRISGAARSLANLGVLMNGVSGCVMLDIPILKNEFYPISLSVLVIDLIDSENDRLTVVADKNKLKLTGTNLAFNKLGDSLINFFDDAANVGDHFQLDYFEGNEVLNDTSCHLIFISDR